MRKVVLPMRKNIKPLLNCILICALTGALLASDLGEPMNVEATSIGEIQNKIEEDQRKLEEIMDQIMGLEDEQDIIQEQVDDLNAEIQNTMTSIGMKEDEIAAKEEEISVMEGEIHWKSHQITETEKEYEAAVEREEQHRQNMAACAKLIYERGEDSYLDALLQGKGLAGILNQMDRVEKVYEYERTVLWEYMETREQVHDLWDRLEEEKVNLEDVKLSLEADKQQLQADQEELKAQKDNLDVMIAKKRQESANFESELQKARQEAAVAKRLLQQDQQKLKQLQAAQNAANATYATTNYTSIIDNASGSDLGKKVAKYAAQYIGNPYVMGGTSLTGGADCSGFTYRVYSDFGYAIPRTSYQQRTAGKGVSYSEAQPGDLICYDGHVGLYIGGGLIVHASNSRPYPSGGIKVSRAEYRTILAVRRII